MRNHRAMCVSVCVCLCVTHKVKQQVTQGQAQATCGGGRHYLKATRARMGVVKNQKNILKLGLISPSFRWTGKHAS